MPTDRSAGRERSAGRALAFAFGAAALFDITGAIIYRALRSQLPEAGEVPPEDPFQLAAMTLQDAHAEAVMRASAPNGVGIPA
jgi:hypothetical protein